MSYGFNARLSGGSANADHNLSIGGVLSSEMVLAQTFAWDGAGVNGVTIIQTFGFNENKTYALSIDQYTGVITLTVDSNSVQLATADVDGDYVLNYGNAGLWLTYTSALNINGESDDFTITNPPTNMFNDITAQQSTTGVIDYRCIYYVNDGDASVDISLSLPSIDSPETYKVGFDGGSVGATAVTITDEYTEPTGVTWSAPTTSSTLDVTLLVGEHIALWTERTLLPNNLYSKYPSKCEILADLSFV